MYPAEPDFGSPMLKEDQAALRSYALYAMHIVRCAFFKVSSMHHSSCLSLMGRMSHEVWSMSAILDFECQAVCDENIIERQSCHFKRKKEKRTLLFEIDPWLDQSIHDSDQDNI